MHLDKNQSPVRPPRKLHPYSNQKTSNTTPTLENLMEVLGEDFGKG